MIRTALLLCAALLAAACFACVPQQIASPPPPIATCSDGSFLNHVKVLQNWNPSNNLTQAPPPGASLGSASPYAVALQNAFQLAPQNFRNQLCALNGVYINEPISCSDFSSCFGNSWGYRVRGHRDEYIAISAGLWSDDRWKPYAPTFKSYVYHLYESDLLRAVYGWNPAWTQYVLPPTYVSANPEADNFDMTVLAALAHELGHVRWYHVLNPDNPGGDYHPNAFCADSIARTNFFSGSWITPVQKPDKWRYFMTRSKRGGTGPTDSHLVDPQILDVDNYLLAADTDSAGAALDQLYRAGYPWASYFSAVSPDEDFVETYKFYVLTNVQLGQITGEGPLASLPLRIYYLNGTYSSQDIAGNYSTPADHSGKPLLRAKTKCIENSM